MSRRLFRRKPKAKADAVTVDGHGTYKGQPFTFGRGVPDFPAMVWAGTVERAEASGHPITIVSPHPDHPNRVACTCGWWEEPMKPKPSQDFLMAIAKRHAESHSPSTGTETQA